jgi:signal transduction histidine kinase
MLIPSVEEISRFDSSFAANAADVQMVSRMRMVLAVAVLLAVSVDPSVLSIVNNFTSLVFFFYLLHSIFVYVSLLQEKSFSKSVLIHRLDVLWFALIVFSTGGVDSFFFLLFFFPIITSSFRWGFEEGGKVTIASALLFAASGWAMEAQHDFPKLLLRTIFLLTLGYMGAYWGESKVRLMHQLDLLRDVSKLSNPRFGVDHTITRILNKTRVFFNASSCMLVLQDRDSGTCSIRSVNEADAGSSMTADPLSTEAALPLMRVSPSHILLYKRPLWPAMASFFQESFEYDCGELRWKKNKEASSKSLAELLEARSFISVPLKLRRQQGRIYIISQNQTLNKPDALFLSHISAQAFPVIENLELLDSMASDAALKERQKISLDLHDTAIQPYIGLKLGLGAIRNKSSFENVLNGDIDRLIGMTDKVIDDLRNFAVAFKTGYEKPEPIFMQVLNQQAARVKEFYGIDISITLAGNAKVSDRLATELLQLVHEGLSNICKHTLAQKGLVDIHFSETVLKIKIENENKNSPVIDFTPRSISERAAGLGGMVHVNQGQGGNTVVTVEIPV